MTSNRTAVFTELIAATLCVCSGACGGGSSPSFSAPPFTVSVSPATATVPAGSTARLIGTVENDREQWQSHMDSILAEVTVQSEPNPAKSV